MGGRSMMRQFISEMGNYFTSPKPLTLRSRSEVLSSWLERVERIHKQAIREGNINAKIRAEITMQKLRNRLYELYTVNYLN